MVYLECFFDRFGSTFPDPQVEYIQFQNEVNTKVFEAGRVWSPAKGTDRAWMDVTKFKSTSSSTSANNSQGNQTVANNIDWRLVGAMIALLIISRLFPGTSLSSYAVATSVGIGAYLGYSLRK